MEVCLIQHEERRVDADESAIDELDTRPRRRALIAVGVREIDHNIE